MLKPVRAKTFERYQTIRPELEGLISRTVTSADYSSSLPGAPDVEYVVIQFSLSFTTKNSAIEKVTPMKDPDG
jgi:hypothetical protein